jgi:peptidoglycan/xylan/chitin deacetylase (PgdA/CDA1 family)
MPNLIKPAPRPAGRPPGRSGPRVPILMYHEVSSDPAVAAWLAASPEGFARQLEYLRASGYHSLSAGQLAEAMKSGAPLPAKPVVLTFDDGTADFYDVALPLLARYGFTATLFATSGWIAGRGGRAGRNAPAGMLTWDQLAEIAGAGIEIGAHTLSHPQLDQLPEDLLRRELTASKSQLEYQLGARVSGVAYPFGYSSRLVRAMSAGAGYEYGCVVGNRLATPSADQFALPRLTIARSTRLPAFAKIVAAQRLPVEFAGYRALTLGWSMVRRIRAARNRAARNRAASDQAAR